VIRQIYLHGLGQSSAAWEKTIALSGSAGRSICPNLAGLLRGREATYENLYTALSDVLDRFDDAIDLCGLSLGGILALNYAIDHPKKVHSLVLIATPYKMPKGLLRFQNILFRFMPKAMFQQTGFGKAEFRRLCMSMAELDFSASIRQVACPALVICGGKDSANQKPAAELAEILEDAELQIIQDTGHEVNVGAPEKLAEALRNFYHKFSSDSYFSKS